jgi:hypothetical protein
LELQTGIDSEGSTSRFAWRASRKTSDSCSVSDRELLQAQYQTARIPAVYVVFCHKSTPEQRLTKTESEREVYVFSSADARFAARKRDTTKNPLKKEPVEESNARSKLQKNPHRDGAGWLVIFIRGTQVIQPRRPAG